MIEESLHAVGGVEYLVERARDPRTAAAYLTLVGKVLPLQVTGEGGGPIQTVVISLPEFRAAAAELAAKV